ncbi:hypothetical protein PIB30_000026 [Stylosanthes scabra]|uniref:Uncharacterized protein n=1 Tax=Stylosanthes scabra TaxID=79078 RepID=A0ABU6Q3B6_9FABA|nr:hypothetical protein [Stylosanthes scabra]
MDSVEEVVNVSHAGKLETSNLLHLSNEVDCRAGVPMVELDVRLDLHADVAPPSSAGKPYTAPPATDEDSVDRRPIFMSPEDEYAESLKVKEDLDSCITSIQQNMVMADCRASRTELLALEVRYEVRQLREEVKAMREEGAALRREKVAFPPPFSLSCGVSGSLAHTDVGGTPQISTKGKEPPTNPVDLGGLFDMVAPHSPSDDDVVFLHERKTVPKNIPDTTVSPNAVVKSACSLRDA